MNGTIKVEVRSPEDSYADTLDAVLYAPDGLQVFLDYGGDIEDMDRASILEFIKEWRKHALAWGCDFEVDQEGVDIYLEDRPILASSELDGDAITGPEEIF